MNKLNAAIENEIQNLVDQGIQYLHRVAYVNSKMEGDELSELASWVTRLGQLIRRLYGENSQHFQSYTSALATRSSTTRCFYSDLRSNNYAHLSQMVGVAKTIKHDLENGLLVNFRAIVQADIFSDFLEMGEYLLQESYKDAAAVIISSVLENGLRKLAEQNNVAVVTESGKQLTIDPLNAELAKREVYSKFIQKQITSWAHIRNKAAHGEFSEYNREEVQMMLLFVQNFMSEHLN